MQGFISAKRIYAEDGVIENGALEIAGTRIGRIVGAGELPHGARAHHLGAAWLLPGIIDMHIHGWKDIDVTDGGPDEISRLPAELASHGVTAFLPTLVSASEQTIIRQVDTIRSLREKGVKGAEILGVHLEGPWLSFDRRGAHPAQWVRNPDKAEVLRILERTKDVVKAVTFSPEIPDAAWLVETLSRDGILPIMGHTNAGYADARRAIEAGARHVTHMYNAMLGFRDNPAELGTLDAGIETAVYLDDRVTAEVIPSLAFVPKPLFELLWRVKGPGRLALVTDAGRGSGYEEGYTMKFSDGRSARVCNDALRLVEDGPLNHGLLGNIDPLTRGLVRFAGYVGAPLETALATVSATPARILGVQDRLGGLKNGKRADFIAVDDQMRVLMTVVAGDVVYKAP